MKLELQDAAKLRQGYSRTVRSLEWLSIGLWVALMIAAAVRLVPWARNNPWLMVIAMICGHLGADFVSGFVHWMCDTWGAPDFRWVGAAFIRPFREHHVDPEAITHHDFVETNGNNCFISLAGPVIGLLLPLGPGRTGSLFWAVFFFSVALWILMTNQFHKWAHLKTPPPLIAWLQRWHLILPPAHHQIHHTAPFNRYYSITVGWVNWPLHWIRFYPSLEWVITTLTGVIPRADDIGKRAALEVLSTEAPANGGLESIQVAKGT